MGGQEKKRREITKLIGNEMQNNRASDKIVLVGENLPAANVG